MSDLRPTVLALALVACEPANAGDRASHVDPPAAATQSGAVKANVATVSASASAPTSPKGPPRSSAAPGRGTQEAPAGTGEVPPATSAAPEDLDAGARCPSGMAQIGRYCIDRWEAHLTLADGTRHPHHLRPRQDVVYRAASAAGVFPQAFISRDEAAAACEQAGKRLCSWLEWRRACQGPKWLRYPYANGGVKGACNTGRDHLLQRLHGDDPRRWEEEDFNDPALALEPGYLAETGSFERCVSAEGVYDMVGNLHEWVGSMVTESFMTKIEDEGVPRDKQPWRVGNGMFLGGFYSTTSEHGPGCHFTTVAHAPRYHDYSTGFRCCADVHPD